MRVRREETLDFEQNKIIMQAALFFPSSVYVFPHDVRSFARYVISNVSNAGVNDTLEAGASVSTP